MSRATFAPCHASLRTTTRTALQICRDADAPVGRPGPGERGECLMSVRACAAVARTASPEFEPMLRELMARASAIQLWYRAVILPQQAVLFLRRRAHARHRDGISSFRRSACASSRRPIRCRRTAVAVAPPARARRLLDRAHGSHRPGAQGAEEARGAAQGARRRRRRGRRRHPHRPALWLTSRPGPARLSDMALSRLRRLLRRRRRVRAA